MASRAVKEVESYLRTAIATFEGDPPDTPFQSGYLAALREVLIFVLEKGLRDENEK